MKDEVVHRAALDEDMRVVGNEPMEIVNRPVACEQVIVLALYGERAAVDVDRLRRTADDPEIARFFGQDSEVERLDQLARARIRSSLGRGAEGDHGSDCHGYGK